MGTIREVWVKNLTALIGEKSKKVVSAESGIPYSTLFNMLNGHIADAANLAKLATYFKVPETHLFVDFEEFGPRRIPSPEEALEVLRRALEAPRPPSGVPADILERLGRADPLELQQIRTIFKITDDGE